MSHRAHWCSAVLYRFSIDCRSSCPWRRSWKDAARDAVDAGYAVWVTPNEIKLDDTQGAAIDRTTQVIR